MENDIKELLEIVAMIDFKLFKKQRLHIVNLINGEPLTPKRLESLEGILNLCDSISDWIQDHPDTREKILFERFL